MSPDIQISDDDEPSWPAVSAASPSSSSALTLLDTFDFDESMPNIVGGGCCLPTNTPTSTDTLLSRNNRNSVVNNAADAVVTSSPFMLGDYSEKEHFLPSSSVIRNEVLEGYIIDPQMNNRNDDGEMGKDTKQPFGGGYCVAFRCIYCKHNLNKGERADMAVIRPQVRDLLFSIFIGYFIAMQLNKSHIIISL